MHYAAIKLVSSQGTQIYGFYILWLYSGVDYHHVNAWSLFCIGI